MDVVQICYTGKLLKYAFDFKWEKNKLWTKKPKHLKKKFIRLASEMVAKKLKR